jgi:hypothetical protein
MPRIPFTLRIDKEERDALEVLSALVGRPVNQIVIDAVKSYLLKQTPNEVSMEARLERLRAYRRRDPEFREAIAQFVEAEVTVADPLEGKPFEEPEGGALGPVQNRIRELLRA